MHIDKVPYEFSKYPAFVRAWATYHRLPAVAIVSLNEGGVKPPVVWAKLRGRDCRLVMASRLGDVGINYTGAETGYTSRHDIEELTDFREVKEHA